MHGQWLGTIEGEYQGTIRLELENRGDGLYGHAFVFYLLEYGLPGFSFQLRLPKVAPFVAQTETTYLYSTGGIMSRDERLDCEEKLIEKFGELPLPATINAEFTFDDSNLTINWSAPDQEAQSINLVRSEIKNASALVARTDITSWDQFRQWAILQKPRAHIFRGQCLPTKLTSTFHRTWRKDLSTWVLNDVRMLFGSLIEKVSYPLQLGNLEHNAAVWSILQHHGYPTPMIDWTYSPFVAAYFAFQNAEVGQHDCPRIFILDQAAWNEKYGRQAFIVDLAPPQLIVLESLAIGNPRTGPQQALSTVTNLADVEAFIRAREQEDARSYLTVCDLPAHEKPNIMRELELMGITYGSLFPGLDGICRDMKERLFAPLI